MTPKRGDLTRNVTRRVLARPRTGEPVPLVVTMAPEGIYVREPRQRKVNARLLPWALVHWHAIKLYVDRELRKDGALRSRKGRHLGRSLFSHTLR